MDDIKKAMDEKLGKRGRDKVTGFEGTIIGKAEYLYGCTQYVLTPGVDKDGKVLDSQWFDEGRIEVLAEAVKPEDVRGERPGGPNRDAPHI